ncbi:MAG: PhzF family phenazine biosynthesis protein [Alphaproteobacteria bacterium]|jgi:PhzF family phenazine biosynthesis protein|nr:PhzF family phenazine biosynthesis protein [Alphaproteobacteria bacterium]MDP6517794.1 PhzF family phenazine biosynthesis protein [Alphaproteobacteria bacterium]
MTQPIEVVDAFTDSAFSGNPAAVCILPNPADADWMQSVAAEMNLSETAFLIARADPVADGFDLRWFTPMIEVDLCGHATLASGHVLWRTGVLDPDATARFHTRSGLLTAAKKADWIELDFPADRIAPAPPEPALDEALGVAPLWLGRNDWVYLVELESEHAVRAVTPDFGALTRIEVVGTIVTARADGGGPDFVSRFFAPRAGIDEDPVTGSAHCVLAPFWCDRLGRTALTAAQVSPRGGVVKVAVDGERVRLAGQAVTILEGALV